MLVLGLAGNAGVGKSSVAAYLAKRFGFIRLSFAGPLRSEVAEAFDLPDTDLLVNRETKDTPTPLLALKRCHDAAFVKLVSEMQDNLHRKLGCDLYLYPEGVAWSPRQILQWWGTEYRRAQDEDYWLKKFDETVAACRGALYPEHRPNFFVVDDARFSNEQNLIHEGYDGNVWHIRRDVIDQAVTDTHASAQPLTVLDQEREIYNNDTLERLHMGVEQMLSSGYRYIKIEPPL